MKYVQFARQCIITALLLIVCHTLGCSSQATVGLSPVTAPPSIKESHTAFVHLFEWRWDDVAQECTAFLGPNGYSAVQVSPPQEHVVVPEEGYPWWQRYQPVSYRLESRSGDRAQFANMVQQCHAAGVKVYADAVINHMAGRESGIGSDGSPFTKYEYPGLYGPDDFHTCREGITDYTNRQMVTNCQLVGLADLKTGSPRVRDRIAAYLEDLRSLGVDGFRIDAAKHIDAGELAAILQQVNQVVEPDPYFYQEVIDPGTEAIKKSEYYPHGDVIEFEYGRLVGETFLEMNGRSLSDLQTLGEGWGLMPNHEAIVFIDNHDKQRGHGGGGTYLTYKNGDLYTLANVFMLAFPYGYPQVMSSFAFENSDQGPPADAQGNTDPVYVNGRAQCESSWVCEHRQGAIAAMVGFRNYTAPVFELTNWWSDGHNQIAFGRGDRGFVVINREATPLTHTFATQLPEGRYCNVIQSGCSPVEVNAQGEFSVTLAPMSALAIHVGAKAD